MIDPSIGAARLLARAALVVGGTPLKRRVLLWGSAVAVFGVLVAGQAVFGQANDMAIPPETEEGIPVTDALTIEKCAVCHAADAKGNLTRISWARATPEGWNQAIKRMARQNGLQITPDETRAVVTYLSGRHGLAPEEARPVMYIPEHRSLDETNIPNETIRTACASCHAFGQPLSWRRSKSDWKKLQNLHVALYAQADAQFRLEVPGAAPAPAGPDGRPAEGPSNADVALDWLAKNAPLHTPAYAAWQARARPALLAGTWLVTADVPGKGRYVGQMTVAAGAKDGTFTTTTTLTALTDGATIRRTGTGIVYGGYAWRGRSGGGGGTAPDALTRDAREAVWFAPDQARGTGRWFWGDYDEFGFDVTLTRATAAPTLLSAAPGAIKAGARGARIRLLGNNLPAGITPADLRFGSGVTVARVVSQGPAEIVAEIDVAPDAIPGMRDADVRGTVLENAFPVYRSVDYLKVTPETSLARLGSTKHPKGYQQFEAIGYTSGPDGQPGTTDDLRVGPVDVTWSLNEFASVYYDDDTRFVGTLSQSALFTPAADGPNPARRFGRNNYGEVWVTATARDAKDKFGRPLTGRSFLVVAVPAYLRWDQPEVSQ